MNDYFERLDLPRRFTLDLDEVERHYLAASRQLHPDFHQNASVAERAASLKLTAELNEAYVSLKDPYRRIEHLLALQLDPTVSQEKNQDQAFLMEMMEIRERIDAASDNCEIEHDLNVRLDALLAEAGRPFDESRKLNPVELAGIRRRLNAAKTLMSLLRDLDAHSTR